MKLIKFEDFMRLENFFYATVGIQPYSYKVNAASGWRTYARQIYLILLIFNVNALALFEIIYVYLAFSNIPHRVNPDAVEAIIVMCYIGISVLGSSKLLWMYGQRKRLNFLVQRLWELFPKTIEQQHSYKIDVHLRQHVQATLSFALLYMITLWTYNFYDMLRYLIYDRVEKQLPYTTYTIWDWRDNWTYYLLYFAQCIAGYTAVSGQLASDLLLSTMAIHLIIHFHYIASSLETYVIKEQVEDGRNHQDVEFLKGIIAYHDNVLSLSVIMNQVFGVMLLFNFLTSIFIICFLGFQLTNGGHRELLFKQFLFFVVTVFQVYFISHYSQELIDASLNVATAAYKNEWFSANIRYKKMLVLLIQRAQKPVQLQATSMLLISRDTLTDVMQLSYKFFALLRTVYAE